MVTALDATLAEHLAPFLIAHEHRHAWMADAACREHPELDFFPTKGKRLEASRAVCAGCAVRAECLDYALQHGVKVGVWGGRSEAERRRLRRGGTSAA